MRGLLYQLKNIRRDKMCILTFLLPVVVGVAIHFLSGTDFSSVGENAFGIVRDDLPAVTVEWLQTNGTVTVFGQTEELEEAVLEPSTQMIGVLRDGDGIRTLLSGDELAMNRTIGTTLPRLYEERQQVPMYRTTIVPPAGDSDGLKSVLIVITLVAAMFMGCTFNAMSMIGEKEDGIVFIQEVLPMTNAEYMIQKLSLGFIGGGLSTAATACICMRIEGRQLVLAVPLIVLSTFIAALTGLFIGRFSSGLMVGIVYIKIIMILFLAPPIVCYLAAPPGSVVRMLSYLLPSSASFYGLMDLLSGQTGKVGVSIGVLAIHCVVWVSVIAIERTAKTR